MHGTGHVFVFFVGVVSSEYLPTAVFVKDVDKLFDSFKSVKRAARGNALRSPLSDNSPHIGHWTKSSMGIKSLILRMVNLPSRNRLNHRMGGLQILELSSMCGER